MVDYFSLWHREGIFPLLTTHVWVPLNPLFSHYRSLICQGVTRLDHEADNFYLGLSLGLLCPTFMHLHCVLLVHRDYVEDISASQFCIQYHLPLCVGGWQDAWDNFHYQVESIKPSHCLFLNVIFFQTTLAYIIANQCKTDNQEARFVTMSATMSGVNDVKDAVKIAKNELRSFKRRTILFMDEIHRFNKLQQVLLYILAIIFSAQSLGYYLPIC